MFIENMFVEIPIASALAREARIGKPSLSQETDRPFLDTRILRANPRDFGTRQLLLNEHRTFSTRPKLSRYQLALLGS